MNENIVIALIGGLCTAIPTTLAVILASRSTAKKLDKQDELTKEHAAVAVIATEKAAEAVDKASNVASTIHEIVNGRLNEAIKQKDEAIRENERLRTLLETAGIKLPRPKEGGK